MRLRMFLLIITFLKASHSFRNRLLVICKNAYLFVFFFSSRRRHTRSLCDWSSDVCSSDLADFSVGRLGSSCASELGGSQPLRACRRRRSEERRVGKECGIVMWLGMLLIIITFLKASHSFRKRLLVICKNTYLFTTIILTTI